MRFFLAYCATVAVLAAPADAAVDKNACALKGFNLHGDIEIVDSFPDLKVQIVTSFPDLRVQWVSSFPDACGQWRKTDSFPDIRVQIVDSFPDLKIQIVDSFPGVP